MALIKSIIILIIGFALLMKGADYFVEGSSSVAKQLHVPSMIIGMTIVAMGTSLPECAVSVTASLTGNNSLAVSNVVGSNIFNLMVVCGACALFAPLTIKKDILKKEFPLSIICAALLMVLGYVGMLLGHLDGGVFLLICSLSDLDDWFCQESKSSTQGKSDDARRGRISRRRNSDPATLEMCIIYCWRHDRNQVWR